MDSVPDRPAVAVPVSRLATPLLAQSGARAENPPGIPMHVVPDFLKRPDRPYPGEAMGVATNYRGHIFAFHRSGDTRPLEFDANGDFVREIGEGIHWCSR